MDMIQKARKNVIVGDERVNDSRDDIRDNGFLEFFEFKFVRGHD